MKKGLRKYAILLLCLLLTWGLLPSAVWAESNASRLPDVVSEPREDTILIDVFGDFETMGADNIIRLLNVYRYQACYYGDWDPRNTSRKLALSDYSGGEDPSDAVLAKPNGDYVPAAWSADLERCAEIRAVEASIYWAHTRPNGYSCFTVNSSIMNNENLAWNFSMLGGIQAWYEERADWVNHGSGQTGHYTNIINPNIIRFGIAAFMNPNISTYYDADYVTVAMSGSMQALSINGAINRSGRYVQRIEIQNGAVGNVSLETQESIQVGQTQTVVANAEMSLAGVWTVQSIAPIAKNVLWNSSDPSILSVDGNGKVKGQKAGTAVITASTAGKQASCTITVTGTQYRIISFNPNGGTVSPTTKTVTYGQAYGALPTPTRSGYTFLGWWTAKETGGKQVTATTVCYASGNYTLYASWKAGQTYTVTLNANGGTCGTSTKTVTYGTAYGTMPVPKRLGYTFAGWWTVKDAGGKKVTASTICYATGNYTLYARWTEGYTMTFDPNGGAVSPTTKVVKYGQQYGAMPTPTRAGYTFTGWWTTKAEGGKKVVSTTVCYAASGYTLYARWTAKKFVVTLNPNGGECATATKTVTYGQAYGTMPVPSPRTGYTFAGWYTAKTGGKKVTATTVCYASGNYTLYARWTPKTYTITFNPNGGSCSTASKKVTYAQQYGTLPTPTRAGYTFAGWFTTQTTGGKQVFSSTVCYATGNYTLYARWTKN